MTPLSSAELSRVAGAQRALLGVLDHPTAAGWMRTACDELRGLFGADQALFTLALPAGYAICTDLSEGAQRAYFDHYHAVDSSGEMLTTFPDPFSTEDDRHGAAHDRYLAGEIYNDYLVPNGFRESISLLAYGRAGAAPLVYERYPDALLGNVLLGGSGMSRGRGAGRAHAMLALLQPALAASARILQDVTIRAGAVVEGLSVPAWLFDETGRCAYESGEVARLAVSSVGADALRAAAGHLAGQALESRRSGALCPPSVAVAVDGRGLAVTWSSLDSGPVPGVIVRVEGGVPKAPGVEALRARFGLTPQQARVALLLAARRSTAEIAAALSISVHTARRHIEAVLERVGVQGRGAIEAAVRGMTAAGTGP